MLSLIIPMYNEEKNIKATVDNLLPFLSAEGIENEIILVNDGSTDKTREIVETLPCRFVSYKDNRGKGYAIRRGAANAKGDVLCFIDCDLSYGLPIIKTGLAALEATKSDIVIGSRRLDKDAYKKYPPLRKLASGVFSFACRAITNVSQPDTQCGFKMYTADAAAALFPECKIDGFAIDLEILMLAEKRKMKITAIPATVVNHGESKVNIFLEPIRMIKDAFAIKKLHRR